MATTPGRLRVASVVLVAVLLLVGVVAAVATSARSTAARSVAREATPELIAAESLYAALADADDAASTAYLRAGEEPPELRQRYRADIDAAGRQLTVVMRRADDGSGAQRAATVIARQLPVYAGLVDTARANIRQGFTVGAAYLRRASALMREEILPEATVIYRHAADRLDGEYDAGTSVTEIVVLGLAGVFALGLLIGLQLHLFSKMHRIVNVGLAAATVLLVVLVTWTFVAFASEQSDLVGAQRHGSDAVEVLSASRILALRAHNDDNLTLIERGGGTDHVADYDAAAARIGGAQGHGGLLDRARAIAARSDDATRIDQIRAHYATLVAAHGAVRALDDNGDYKGALDQAKAQLSPAIATVDRDFRIEIARARVELERRAENAQTGFGVLAIVIPVLTVAAGLLVLVGLQRRIGEYR